MKYLGQSKKQIKYEVELLSSAAKEFRNLPAQIQSTIKDNIDTLITNPYSYKSKKLRNSDLYRIRIGKYRIIYFVEEKKNKVIITKIGHRKEVYR